MVKLGEDYRKLIG